MCDRKAGIKFCERKNDVVDETDTLQNDFAFEKPTECILDEKAQNKKSKAWHFPKDVHLVGQL